MHQIITDTEYEIDYIDPSGCTRFSQCPARYLFERILGLENPDRDKTALDYGTDMHYVLPMCYGCKNHQEEQERLEQVVEVFGKLRARRQIPSDDKKHTMEMSIGRLRNFIEMHNAICCPYDIVHFPFSVPEEAKLISANEVPFAVDIGGNLPLLGRIDMPVKIRQTAELFAGDYKTASEISGRLWESFDLNIQAIGYTLALQTLVPEKAFGMMVEAIRKSTDKKRTECAIHFQYVSNTELELGMGYLNYTADEILNCNSSKKWPKRLSGCNTYCITGFPGSNCPFKILCKAEDWRTMESYYHHSKPFHPFDIDDGD